MPQSFNLLARYLRNQFGVTPQATAERPSAEQAPQPPQPPAHFGTLPRQAGLLFDTGNTVHGDALVEHMPTERWRLALQRERLHGQIQMLEARRQHLLHVADGEGSPEVEAMDRRLHWLKLQQTHLQEAWESALKQAGLSVRLYEGWRNLRQKFAIPSDSLLRGMLQRLFPKHYQLSGLGKELGELSDALDTKLDPAAYRRLEVGLQEAERIAKELGSIKH